MPPTVLPRGMDDYLSTEANTPKLPSLSSFRLSTASHLPDAAKVSTLRNVDPVPAETLDF